MTQNIGNIWIRYSKKWRTYYHTTLIQIQTAQLPWHTQIDGNSSTNSVENIVTIEPRIGKNSPMNNKKTCHVRCSCTSNRDRPRCVDDQIKINNQSAENVITPALMQSKQCQWIYYKDTRHQSLFPCNTCKMSSKAFSNLGPLETVLDNQVHQLYWKVMHIPRKKIEPWITIHHLTVLP